MKCCSDCIVYSVKRGQSQVFPPILVLQKHWGSFDTCDRIELSGFHLIRSWITVPQLQHRSWIIEVSECSLVPTQVRACLSCKIPDNAQIVITSKLFVAAEVTFRTDIFTRSFVVNLLCLHTTKSMLSVEWDNYTVLGAASLVSLEMWVTHDTRTGKTDRCSRIERESLDSRIISHSDTHIPSCTVTDVSNKLSGLQALLLFIHSHMFVPCWKTSSHTAGFRSLNVRPHDVFILLNGCTDCQREARRNEFYKWG